MDTVKEDSTEDGLTVNVAKTKALKFGTGGLPSAGDIVKIYGQQIGVVDCSSYLGSESTRRGIPASSLIRERELRGASRALASIPRPRALSLSTALALFKMEILPIIACGIDLIWDDLGRHRLASLDKFGTSYLKRALEVHGTSRYPMVYALARTEALREQLTRRFHLRTAETGEENGRNRLNFRWYTTHNQGNWWR